MTRYFAMSTVFTCNLMLAVSGLHAEPDSPEVPPSVKQVASHGSSIDHAAPTSNGLRWNGFETNGMRFNGFRYNGLRVNAHVSNGTTNNSGYAAPFLDQGERDFLRALSAAPLNGSAVAKDTR